MRIHLLPPSPRALKVQAVAAAVGADLDVHVLDYARSEQASERFERLNPNRRQPVLEDGDFVLWESNAILIYIAQSCGPTKLWPDSLREQADVLRWLFWESSQWDLAWDILITEKLKKQVFNVSFSGRRTLGAAGAPAAPDAERLKEGALELAELCGILDRHLARRSWLCGPTCTLADYAVAAWLPVAHLVDFDLGPFQQLRIWQAKVLNQPGWPEVLAGLAQGAGRSPAMAQV
jgi:glutathione S-transferase